MSCETDFAKTHEDTGQKGKYVLVPGQIFHRDTIPHRELLLSLHSRSGTKEIRIKAQHTTDLTAVDCWMNQALT